MPLLRARVNERLTRAARFPVTLVVAPAGFGKSVALRDLVETARLEVVRYDVGRDETTLLAFVRGLSRALAPLAPDLLTAFPATEERVRAADDPVRELTEWFGEHLKRAVGTVLIDDLHHAAGDPRAVALLVQLVESTSGRIRWIVASRTDAGLPVASWIGYGRMDLPVGEDELLLTPEEALAAAAEVDGAADPSEVEALRTLTGGWPVAMGIALRTRMHAFDLVSAASGTREMIYRYLAEQVFGALTRAQQRFLLSTAVLPSFDEATAEALGMAPGPFDELRRSVTFFSTTPDGALRYHDLFRDFLERELRRIGATAWYDAHVGAGALLEGRGDDIGALAVYTKVGAGEEIEHVISRTGIALLDRGAGETLAGALAVLPENVRRENAAVLGVRAMLDANRGEFDVAERDFLAAIERAGDDALRLELVHRYAIALVRYDRDCVPLLEPYAHDESLPAAVRVPILGTLATAYVRAGRRDASLRVAADALERAEALADEARARLYQQAAYVYHFGGVLPQARRYAALAAELATSCGLFDVAARAYSVLYAVNGDEDDPLAMLANLDKLGESARKGGSSQVRMFGIVAAYAIHTERGDDEALARLDREFEDESGAPQPARVQALLPALALRATWHGDFRLAYELIAGSTQDQPTHERRAIRSAEIALYAFAAGLNDEGAHARDETIAAIEASPRATFRVVRAHLVLALAELVRGRDAAAHRHLAEAERLLTPAMRRVRALAAAVRVLYRVVLEQAETALLAGALERLRGEHAGGLARMIDALPLARPETGYARLTPSEREILQLLAQGASTKDVAAKTGRSPQTVDTHIRSICRKLNCSGRREAVARATVAGWVTP
jgi:LuxR family maltose regulon positive regulatory protein